MNDYSKPIVIKLGGSIFDARDVTLIDLVQLQNKGYKLVVVHGGAKLVTAWCAELGINSQFHQGERITDRRSLDVVTAVLSGLANKETVAAVIRAGGRAAGISGSDGGLLQAHIRDSALGYIGEVKQVDPHLISALLGAGYMPVISPISYFDDPNGDEPLLLNVNGDTAAGEIARAVGASKLIYLTDVAGIRGAGGEVITSLSPAEAQELLANEVASGGMVPKLTSCLLAAGAGVICHIVDGRRPNALAEAVSGVATGTTVYPQE